MTIGRNDPCPCGSGKKYKKCCMLKNQPKSASQLLSNVKVIRSSNSLLGRIATTAPKSQPDELVVEKPSEKPDEVQADKPQGNKED